MPPMEDAEDVRWRANVDTKLETIESELKDLDHKFDSYTHLFQFTPVRNIAFGLVGAFGLGIVGALIGILVAGGAGTTP